MRKIFTLTLCAILSVVAMAQTTHNMQIKLKTGELITYKTTDVENIKFEEENTPNPPQGAFEAEFLLQELTSTSCKVKITPSNDTRYYAHIWMSDFMTNENGGLLPDKTIIETCIPDPAFDSKCHVGETVVKLENGIPEGQFVVIVFDAEAQYGKDVPVFSYRIKLNEGLDPEAQFEITNQVIGFEDVSFHAKAKDPSKFMIARVLEKSYFDKHGETVMQNLYFMLQNASVEKLVELSEYVKDNGAYGEKDFYFNGLKPNTEYTAAVFYVDPTNDDVSTIYDWNYTRWDFTTKTPSSKPTLELTNAKKTRNTDGTINISVHAKATNATKALMFVRTLSDVQSVDLDNASDLYFGMKGLTAAQLEQLNSPEGLDIYIPSYDMDDEWCLIMRVIDAEGGRASSAAVLEW